MDPIEQREKEDFKLDFRINNYIKLRLERNLRRKITDIYIKGKRVHQFDEIDSIDGTSEIVDKYLLESDIVREEHVIPVNDVHCSISLNGRIACLIS